ncbi:RING-14 protein [Zalerion maritima]|uniref:RING-14 protein n=1 Tax=Zalerion maritima TaxID=339359 RepID=A0AAD5WSC7_9PEZI|nr:RING-14 protein [Zalerion maritima]
MKFAREFRTALVQEGFPHRWVDTAIPYGQLKKCLKKVESELHDVGLDPTTLKQFLEDNNVDYNLEETKDLQCIRPRLTVTVHMRDGVLVDAALTPATRTFLEGLTGVAGNRDGNSRTSVYSANSSSTENTTSISSADADTQGENNNNSSSESDESACKVEVPLVFDAQFFSLLQSDVLSLSALQDEQKRTMSFTITTLRSDLAKVTKPSRFHIHKNDMEVWREVFRLYLDANIFFSTLESDHGNRTSEQAGKALEWWAGEVRKRGLLGKFKVAESKDVMERFVGLNREVLLNLRFQELNQRAVVKILKSMFCHPLDHPIHPMMEEFANWGSPGKYRVRQAHPPLHDADVPALLADAQPVQPAAPSLVGGEGHVRGHLERASPPRAAAAGLPLSYLRQHCELSYETQVWPRCVQQVHEQDVEEEDADVDWEREKLNRKYFPRETREKHGADRIELGRELHGDSYDPSECVVM